MRKFFYFLLWPFNRLYDLIYSVCEVYDNNNKDFVKVHEEKVHEDKVLYIVIGYYIDDYIDDEKSICSVCDDLNLSADYANDLRRLGKFYRVDIVDYTLNRLYD